MSNKTNNSDISSNEDGVLYKYDDLRSLTSFNSSEMSQDTKNPDSGIGTSTTSSYNHKSNSLIIKNVELLKELQSLLKFPTPISKSHEKTEIKFDSCSESSAYIDKIKKVISDKDSCTDPTPSVSDTNTTDNSKTKTDYDVDLLVYKAIEYIKKLKKSQSKKPSENTINIGNHLKNPQPSSPSSSTDSSCNKEIIANISYKNEEMCISILVKTGLIVYVDERLTDLLGQNAKAWINRRPIDYLYKDDINLLLTKLCELTNKINNGCKNISEIEIEPFYLRFKKENNKSGANSIEIDVNFNRPNSSEYTSSSSTSPISHSNDFMPRLVYNCDSNEYLAFRVELKADKVELKTFELDEKVNKANLIQNPHNQLKQSQHQELINLETCILFKLSYPSIAYFKDIDNYTERSFISEHDVNLQITRVENKVTELLGYLPQELERKSLIKFIHPDDLLKIKQIHFDIFDGKERQNQEIYRWRCHNGCYVSVRTNWSWFIHPWKKQIDFIIGKHVVLVDPMNKNIFEDNKKYDIPIKNSVTINNKTTSSSSQQINQKSNASSSNVNLISYKSTGTNSDESNNDKRTFNLSSTKDDESDFSNKIEKDIIEYISRKIPGMDDATQMLGQDVIKFIKKKNISASYCQEQSRIMKKKSLISKNYRPLQKYKYAYDYPQYFQSRPHLEKSAFKRLANFQSYHSKNRPINIRSSSSSNSEYARVKAKFALRRNKRLTKAMTSKQADAIDTSEHNNLDFSDESKINIISSQESIQESKLMNKTQPSPAESFLSPAPKATTKQIENHNLPSLFEDIFSKKSFQPSLIKDHTFFTQYMICKYIDDLPNSWTVDDNAAANSGDVTAYQDSCPENIVKTENRGTKRPLDDEENQGPNDYALENTTKARKLSTNNNENSITNIYPKNQTANFLGEKTVLDYLINNNEHSNLVNVNSNEDQTIYKKANSYSSKSHSRIVLIDENDNDDEEETVKMIISQTSEDNPVEYSLLAKNENQSISIQSNNLKPELKITTEKCARLTKENLAKHTREQDEIYLTEILKKVQKNFPKKISENPQNICAQAPNVFSSNEYEPQMKKIKKMHQILTEKNPNSPVSSAELAAQYENELNLGPYSGAINEIDFDNPQNYHESFNKKLQADLILAKDLKPIEKLTEKLCLDKNVDENRNNNSQKPTKSSGKDKDSTINSSHPSSSSIKNDDVLSFWKKCIRQGSAIVKRIKEADNLIKIISSANQKKSEIELTIQNQENLQSYSDPNLVNMNILQGDSRENVNDQVVLLKFTKQLKKRLYIIASLLGINTDIGFDDISIDSDKSEIIESFVKKIVQELLKTNDSVNITRYTNKITSKNLDTNSLELLICVYEDLKNKFLSQFDRFNKDNKLIFNSSSSAAFPSSTSNNDDETSSQNQVQRNINNISRSVKSKSPNDFEFSSHNTNEFDDSSTYLYDSPTSSLESTDMLSLSNNAKKISTASRRPKSNKSKLSSEEIKMIQKQRSSNQEENGFDDGLLCKIMQNYIELFKRNDEIEPVINLEDSKFCVKSNKTSTDESAKIATESCSRSNDSEETKSNKTKNEASESKIEEECIKNLSINIYNDCFKCLSKVSALENQKTNSNENESD